MFFRAHGDLEMTIGQQQRFATAALVACMALSLVGCGQKTIVGKWSGVASAPGGMTANMVEDFRADGTATVALTIMGRNITMNGAYKAENGVLTLLTPYRNRPNATMSQTFQYTLDGDTLTMNSPHEPAPIVLKRQG
jgi:hypothetical protein